jgi:hypothetical protein
MVTSVQPTTGDPFADLAPKDPFADLAPGHGHAGNIDLRQPTPPTKPLLTPLPAGTPTPAPTSGAGTLPAFAKTASDQTSPTAQGLVAGSRHFHDQTTVGGVLGGMAEDVLTHPDQAILQTAIPNVPGVIHSVQDVGHYLGQKAAELSLPAKERAEAEADPNRVPGARAGVEAAMLAAPALIHGGVNAYRDIRGAIEAPGPWESTPAGDLPEAEGIALSRAERMPTPADPFADLAPQATAEAVPASGVKFTDKRAASAMVPEPKILTPSEASATPGKLILPETPAAGGKILSATTEAPPPSGPLLDRFGMPPTGPGTTPTGIYDATGIGRRPVEELPVEQRPPVEPPPDATTQSFGGTVGRRPGEAVGTPALPDTPVSIPGVYRGVPRGVDASAPGIGGGRFFSPDKSLAEAYARGGSVVQEDLTFQRPLRAQNWVAAKQALGLPNTTSMEDLIAGAKQAGHDGIIFERHNGQPEYVALNEGRSSPVEPPEGAQTVSAGGTDPTKLQPVVSANGTFEARPGVLRKVNADLGNDGGATPTAASLAEQPEVSGTRSFVARETTPGTAPANTPEPRPSDILNVAKLNLEDQTAEQRVAERLEQFRSMRDEQKQTFDEADVNRKAIMDELTAGNPKALSPAAAAKLSGEELLARRDVVNQNDQMIGSLSKAIASGTMTAAEQDAATQLMEKAVNHNDALLKDLVTGSSQKGRDLNLLRRMANTDLDPATWLVQAKRMLGDKPLTDDMMSDIRRLVQTAVDACG